MHKLSGTVKIILTAALAALMCALLCACGGNGPTDDPNKDAPGKEFGTTLMMVASYNNNAVVGGKLLVTAKDEYAFVEFGKDITAENIVVYKYEHDLKSMVGIPAVYKVKDGVITDIQQPAAELSKATYQLAYSDGKVCDSAGEYSMSKAFTANPEKYFFVLDGWTVKAATPDSAYGFGRKSDDTIKIFDIDGDGMYDYATYVPTYNAVEVVAVDGEKLTLKNAYGSASLPEVLANETTFYCKKSLSSKSPKVGSLINVTIRVDCDSTQKYNDIPVAVTYVSDCDTVAAPLAASVYNSESDIMNRVNGNVTYWSSAFSKDEASSGRDSVKKSDVNKCYRFVYDTAGFIVCAKPVSIDDVEFESLVSGTSFESENGTMVSGTLDVQGMWHGTTTYSTVQTYVSLLYQMGLRRLYIVISGPGYPMFAASKNGYSARKNFDAAITYFKHMGFEMPDHSFVKACHDKGMECYAIYKIYEGGGGSTAPIGATVGYNQTYKDDIFGQRLGFDTILQDGFESGNDYRIARRADGVNDSLEGTVDKIRIEFLSDGYSFRPNSGLRTELKTVNALSASAIKQIADGKTYTNKNQHPVYGINLWVSDDNGQYKLYDGSYTYKYTEDKQVIKDVNGDDMFDGAEKKVIALEITGIGIEEKFCAVTFNCTTNLRLNVFSMTHIYSGGREIISSTTRYTRHMYKDYGNDDNPNEYVWGYEDYPARIFDSLSFKLDKDGNPVAEPKNSTNDVVADAEAAAKFTKYGFEFNWYPYGEEISTNNSIIPIARGRVETFPGGACEAYEEVRGGWLAHVKTLLEASFDGVEIRLQSHSSMVPDYKNYGYNEPIVEKYKELYGESAYNTLMDPGHQVTDEEYLRIMQIRGEFTYMFLEEASKLCREYGAEFSVNLREAYIDPIVSHCLNEATWWTMPKIVLDWKKCVDISTYVSIKDYIYSEIYVQRKAKEIKDYAYSQGKDVWIQCYDEQAGMLTKLFFRQADNDPTITGFTIYELSDVLGYTSGGLKNMLAEAGFTVVSKADEMKNQCIEAGK